MKHAHHIARIVPTLTVLTRNPERRLQHTRNLPNAGESQGLGLEIERARGGSSSGAVRGVRAIARCDNSLPWGSPNRAARRRFGGPTRRSTRGCCDRLSNSQEGAIGRRIAVLGSLRLTRCLGFFSTPTSNRFHDGYCLGFRRTRSRRRQTPWSRPANRKPPMCDLPRAPPRRLLGTTR